MARAVSSNYATVVAQSGTEAKGILEQDRVFHAIICDLMMPEGSGMDLHRWVSEVHSELASKMVFITGGVFTANARAFIQRVKNPVLEKPVNAAALLAVLDEVT